MKGYTLEFDDIVTDEDNHQWTQLCCGHAEQIEEENGNCGIDIGGSGICGVEGCDVESEYYLDFEDPIKTLKKFLEVTEYVRGTNHPSVGILRAKIKELEICDNLAIDVMTYFLFDNESI